VNADVRGGFQIATWNVNSLRVRSPQLMEWLQTHSPDVVALQETKLQDHDFPEEQFRAAGYHCAFSGQKTYNGVALLSRHPMTDLIRDIPDFDDAPRRVLAATIDAPDGTRFRVVNLYVPNGQAPGSEKFAYKLRWLEALTKWLKNEAAAHPGLVVLGDFNVAPEDRDVHDPVLWRGRILFSDPEKEALLAVKQWGFVDAFRMHNSEEKQFSWWDYRAGAFRRNMGLRIDHVWVTEALAKQTASVVIDKEPRRWEKPSDHAPVVAEFN
jgi:exodeoxyribonuclease-3